MPLARASGIARSFLLGLSLLAVLLAAGCASPQGTPQTTVFPMTEAADTIQGLYVWIFWMSAVVFVLTQGGIIYIVWRYRYRPEHPLPEQVHGNTKLEILWTILPAVILVAIAIPTFQAVFYLEGPPPVSAATGGQPAGAMQIEVVGHQWWWEFRYPEQGVVTANEMIIPVGRTVELKMTSADVVHSFWIPQLMGKQDVMPAHTNALWFTARAPGQYFGQCAEYCGIQHAEMRMNVIAYEPADFQAWVARSQQPAQPTTELAQRGADVFRSNACVGCHTIAGTPAQGKLAPDLSHFGSRTTLAAGIIQNTPENLAAWLRNPDEIKPGNHMSNPPDRWNLNLSRDYLNLRPADVDALVEYLHSLK